MSHGRLALNPKFYNDSALEVRFVAAEFPGDEEFFISGSKRVMRKTGIVVDESILVQGLHSGKYWGFRVFLEDECVGGIVTETVRKEHAGQDVLHIWLLWGMKIKEWLGPALRAARRMADDTGCEKVRLASTRWAWIKLLPPGELSWVMEI